MMLFLSTSADHVSYLSEIGLHRLVVNMREDYLTNEETQEKLWLLETILTLNKLEQLPNRVFTSTTVHDSYSLFSFRDFFTHVHYLHYTYA